MNTVIFDLDGTITDPAEGIVQSFNYTLSELGFNPRPREELLEFIGPPLNVSFYKLAGINDKTTLSRAVELFRGRIFSVAYAQNQIYDGISEVLSQLHAGGSRLCIATQKRQDIAVKVAEFLHIKHFFTQILGCDLLQPKSELLRDILSDNILGSRPIVMIGDRATDYIAASEVNMPSIAVRWGYGDESEYALATDVVDRPEDLPLSILNHASLVPKAEI